MESLIKESKGLKRQLELKIPVENVNNSFLKNYQKIQQKLKLPGFRQGKVPLNTVKQNYKDQVIKEVLDDLFKSHYAKALKQSSLNPVSSPTLLNCDLQEGKEALLLLELEVHPEVKVEKHLELEVEKKRVKITKENLEETLKKIQDSYKTFEDDTDHKKPSQKGDCLSISLSAFDSNKKTVLEIKELLLEELGKDLVLQGLDEKLLDLKTGEEKEFSFSFPNAFLNAHNKTQNNQQSIQGHQSLQTKIKLLSFKKKILPPIDDKFAKKFKVENLKELKNKIEEDLKKNLEQKEQDKLENSVLEKLVEKNPLELPTALLADQMERLKKNTKKNLEAYQFSPSDQEAYLKKHEKEFEKEARFTLHLSYLVEQLIQDLKISLKPEDMESSLKESFPNKATKEMEENLKKSGHWEQFLFHLRRRKVISHLLDKAKIKEVE